MEAMENRNYFKLEEWGMIFFLMLVHSILVFMNTITIGEWFVITYLIYAIISQISFNFRMLRMISNRIEQVKNCCNNQRKD